MQISVVSDSPEFQVTDDLALLDAMLDDLRAADEVWQPTNYWSRYTDETIARLRSGLHDFRRARPMATSDASGRRIRRPAWWRGFGRRTSAWRPPSTTRSVR